MNFNVYDTNFSDQVLVTCDDCGIEILIKALGVAFSVGMSEKEAMELAAKITPNPWLRRELVLLNGNMEDFCFTVEQTFEENYLLSFYRYGKQFNKLGKMLLMYAEDSGVLDHALAKQIGWLPEVSLLMRNMHKNLQYPFSTEHCIERLAYDIQSEPLNSKLWDIRHAIVSENFLIGDAFEKHLKDWIDPFTLAIIKVPKNRFELESAFKFLAAA